MTIRIGIREPFRCEVTRNWLDNTIEVNVEFFGIVGEDEFDRAMGSVRQLLGIKVDGINAAHTPAPERVIINDPATVVFFDDGSKVVTKATCGDEYDPLFGIMACALRKVGKNRVTVDLWEPVIGFLADFLADADECRLIAEMLTTTADALELDGVMDAIEDYDSRAEEPEEPIERIRIMRERIDEDIRRLDDVLHEHERTRQTIRNLVDRGEL